MKPSDLTIGMAVYRDYEGVWATLQDLRSHHPRVQLLVVDNQPNGPTGTNHVGQVVGCDDARNVTVACGGRYFHRPDLTGTSAPRDAVFRFSRTPWTCCVDSHIIFQPGAVQALLDWIDKNPDSNDLVQGPLLYDDGVTLCTHWTVEPSAWPGKWGAWDRAWRHKSGGPVFGVRREPPRPEPGQPSRPFVFDLLKPMVEIQVPGLPAIDNFDQHNAAYKAAGFVHADEVCETFPIDHQGLGMFAMKTSAWPGFNPLARGFGGEEGYLHELVRQRGGQALCLSKAAWKHRFRNGKGTPYPAATEDHTWNLLLFHREFGIDATPQIWEHFGKKMDGDAAGKFKHFIDRAAAKQPFGKHHEPTKKLKMLVCWYTNNAAPESLMLHSLQSIQRAQHESWHEVKVATCPWRPVPGNPFPEYLAKYTAGPGHLNIVRQIRQCIESVKPWPFDAVVFCEHDVLYPPDHFDRLGDALARSDATVAVNLDYEGMNATGYLNVKQRDEPLHQIAMRREAALANLDRAERDCVEHGWTLLEPASQPLTKLEGKTVLGQMPDRSSWARVRVHGARPAIHVNF